MIFCCSSCGTALLAGDPESLYCSRCERQFRKLGGVWCLVSQPESWASVWQRRSDVYCELAQQRIQELHAQLQLASSSPLTQRRLSRISSALKEQRDQIAWHFELLGARSPVSSKSTVPLLLSSGSSPVLKCYENLFRDWSWGADEVTQSLELVRRLAPARLGKLAVYGAGAGRLAVDVHQALKPEQTVALDINPLPLLVAARLIRGETVTLPEFPVGPHTEQDVAVRQTLRCTSEVDPGFSLAFADVLRPPFAPRSLDTVLTSWVIDAVDADFEQTALSIQHALSFGGTWINTGPLRFDGRIAEAYSREEVLEITRACGFELVTEFDHVLDYFHSPHSGSHRRETVFCFAARKTAELIERPQAGVRAAWLMDVNQPVVLTSSANALRRKSIVTVGVLSLVDGKRSLVDIANALAEQWRVPPGTLVDALRELFVQLSES
jgi:N2227-like protein